MAFEDLQSVWQAVARDGGIFSWGWGSRAGRPRGMQILVSADGKNRYRQRSGDGLSTLTRRPDEADQIVARSPGEALKEMNAVSRQPRWAMRVLAGGAALALLSLAVHFFLVAAALAALTAAAFVRARPADDQRRRFALEYQMDADARERWVLMNHAVGALTRTERLWQITSRDYAHSWKQGTGASALVTRTPAALSRETPVELISSLTPYCLHLGPQRWLFFPDRLYVRQNDSYMAVDYKHLRLKTSRIRFIEEERVPSDAQVGGRQWQRTAAGDRQGIPIAQYGVLEIRSPSGLRAVLHVSSVGAADQFAALFQSFQSYRRSDGEMPPQEPPSEECYGRLGLTPACTQAEATRRFRQLVLAHHPDRMQPAGPGVSDRAQAEAKERANAEMQEIVLAYKDLKRLRGW